MRDPKLIYLDASGASGALKFAQSAQSVSRRSLGPGFETASRNCFIRPQLQCSRNQLIAAGADRLS